MNDNVVAFVSRWRGRYHRRFVVGSCPAARRRQWAWESFPLRRRQFHRYRTVVADSTGIRRPDAFAHRGAAASGNTRSKTARSRRRTQAEIEAGPSVGATLSRDSRAAQRIEVPDHVGDSCFGCPSVGQPAESCLVVAPVLGTACHDRTGKTQTGRPYVILTTLLLRTELPSSRSRQTTDSTPAFVVVATRSAAHFGRSGPLNRLGPLRAE